MYCSGQNDCLFNSEGIRSATVKIRIFNRSLGEFDQQNAKVNACLIDTGVLSECSFLYFLFVVVSAMMYLFTC